MRIIRISKRAFDLMGMDEYIFSEIYPKVKKYQSKMADMGVIPYNGMDYTYKRLNVKSYFEKIFEKIGKTPETWNFTTLNVTTYIHYSRLEKGMMTTAEFEQQPEMSSKAMNEMVIKCVEYSTPEEIINSIRHECQHYVLESLNNFVLASENKEFKHKFPKYIGRRDPQSYLSPAHQNKDLYVRTPSEIQAFSADIASEMFTSYKDTIHKMPSLSPNQWFSMHFKYFFKKIKDFAQIDEATEKIYAKSTYDNFVKRVANFH
jgi:hypothetical protein